MVVDYSKDELPMMTGCDVTWREPVAKTPLTLDCSLNENKPYSNTDQISYVSVSSGQPTYNIGVKTLYWRPTRGPNSDLAKGKFFSRSLSEFFLLESNFSK